MTEKINTRFQSRHVHQSWRATFFNGRSFRLGLFGLLALPVLMACSTTPPEGLSAVYPFDVRRYAGTWYEIARLDHSFERGLSDVSASYRQQEDGSVEVINRGYDRVRNEWRQAVGRAVFTGDSNRASLKVSFFGPFYGGYHVVALEPDYRWAMVVGPDRDYLWILARDKQLPEEVRGKLLHQAKDMGFKIERLIWVEQLRHDSGG
jgi:apolipoprotein D and lipocalin family protein